MVLFGPGSSDQGLTVIGEGKNRRVVPRGGVVRAVGEERQYGVEFIVIPTLQEERNINRAGGVVQLAGGAFEAGVGVALVPETGFGSLLLLPPAGDVMFAAGRTIWTGEPTATGLQQLGTAIATKAGADPETAGIAGVGFEILIHVSAGFAASGMSSAAVPKGTPPLVVLNPEFVPDATRIAGLSSVLEEVAVAESGGTVILDALVEEVAPAGINPGSNESVYRAMSAKEFARLEANQGLMIRQKGSSELGITLNQEYMADLTSRTARVSNQYKVIVEFEVAPGTWDSLLSQSATHPSASELFPNLPAYKKGMPVPMVKVERGEVVSILLGKNPEAVSQFNSSIIVIKRIP